MNNILNYADIVTVQAIRQEVNTESLFDKSFKEQDLSPLDHFLTNANKINLLWINNQEISREMATIVFLGYMSAVESYIRALVRGLIQVDYLSLKIASSKEITFGAALYHTKQLLPEALMDEFSFVHCDNIKTTFKDLVGLQLSLNNKIEAEFNKICQLRHCCVHRFGKLGAKNAIKLGIDKHNALFEKPLILTVNDLTLIAQNLRSIVKQINNALYKETLDRTFPIPKNKTQRKEFEQNGIKNIWTKNYDDDKELFKSYYSLFCTKVDSIKSQQPKKLYDAFIQARSDEEAKKINES
ncbi:hypothetical protein [Pectobacterium carotovorum]|uniref:hypothetical protein n=1 Tax=Pectobacterium carotovorum TaxID=554 RepID=UPI00057C6379|nr:hypothetical protein [Pectobacterium carotovorum]KHT28560.1 hypothetical protein RC98_08675 [Pectobacterium carotovorum subsp. carotovorum]